MKSESETFFDEKPEERVKEELKAADAAMFDVRCQMSEVRGQRSATAN